MRYRLHRYEGFIREQEETGPVPYVPDESVSAEAEEKKRETLKELQQRMNEYRSVKNRLETAFKRAGEDRNYDIDKEVSIIHGNRQNTEDRNPLVMALEQVLRAQLRITRAERKMAEDVNTKTELESKLRELKGMSPEDRVAKDSHKETIDRLTEEINELNRQISDNSQIKELKDKFKEAEESMKELFEKEKEKLDNMMRES